MPADSRSLKHFFSCSFIRAMVAGGLFRQPAVSVLFGIYFVFNKNIVDGKLSATFKKNSFVLSTPFAKVCKEVCA
jgi:hypothetical protein